MHFRLPSSALVALTIATAAAQPDALSDAINGGKLSLNVRTRYEAVEQTGLRDAGALTLRARLGFTTAPVNGLKALLEFEHISALDGDRYSQAGLNPGGAGRAVVADPEGTEVNQAALSFAPQATTFTLGRQRLVLDNARFVGDVGWRQNQQTFDAITVQDKTLAGTTLTYAWLQQINRVFGADHAQGRWDSASHVFHANHTGFAAGTLTGYAYLLDFDNAPANSSATYGASLTGSRATGTGKISWRAEFATQTDHGNAPSDYRADYHALEAGFARDGVGLTLGQEQLGSDRGVGFKTPLATLHAFNGWADLFLATPAAGLRDRYAKLSATLPGGFNLLLAHHRFAAATGGGNYGREWDLQLSRKLNAHFTGLVKLADFDPANATLPAVRKLWLQIEYSL
ncbi:MAG: hypothetical protein H3C27_04660 [Opitutaceae bacterium]|nr:hypothetical protein [Opitutaceae bacterium]